MVFIQLSVGTWPLSLSLTRLAQDRRVRLQADVNEKAGELDLANFRRI